MLQRPREVFIYSFLYIIPLFPQKCYFFEVKIIVKRINQINKTIDIFVKCSSLFPQGCIIFKSVHTNIFVSSRNLLQLLNNIIDSGCFMNLLPSLLNKLPPAEIRELP